MEIIHVVLGKANPDRMNGVNKVVYNLAIQQTINQSKVEIWGIAKDLRKNYADRPFNTRLFRAPKFPLAISAEMKKAIKKKKGKAVFHLHGSWIPHFYMIGLILKKHEIPYVLTPHGGYNTIAMNKRRIKKKIYFRLLESRLVQNANYVHCLGQSEVDGLISIAKNTKSSIIKYGFEINAKSRKQNSYAKEFIMGFVGRIDIYTKGLDIILDAFPKFVKKHGNAKLWIIGDGPDMSRVQDLVSDMDCQEKVTIFGSKYGAEKDDLMSQMNVFLHPSRNEGLPNAILEAASLGVPTIASKATNLADYIHQYQSGIALADNSSVEMEAAMTDMFRLFSKGLLTKVSHHAIMMLNQQFNWATVIKQFQQLYHECSHH